MSVANQLGISEELLRLVDRAFDHAMPTLRESGEPFNPFVMAEGGAKPHFQRFVGEDTEAAVAFARNAIASLPQDACRYALAFDARIALDGAKQDAVVVEAGERGSNFGVAFALRYRASSSAKRTFEEVGNPKYVARVDNHFKETANCCMVFFRSGVCDLEAAASSLAGYGLTVTRQDDRLIAGYPQSPKFRIRLVAGDSVRAEAAAIGKGTPHAAAMQGCDAKFEISFDSLDDVLDEINTLMEVQSALQEASQGFLFLPWNGNLSEPWRD